MTFPNVSPLRSETIALLRTSQPQKSAVVGKRRLSLRSDIHVQSAAVGALAQALRAR